MRFWASQPASTTGMQARTDAADSFARKSPRVLMFVVTQTGTVEPFTGGDQTTSGGVPALTFTSTDGTATVAAAEPHYLLRMQAPKNGTLEFSDWDKPTTVTAPKAAEIYSGPGA